MGDTTGIGTTSGAAKASAAAAAGTFAFADLPPMGALGIDEMMEYLSSYLNNSDADIRAKMAELKDKKDEGEALGEMMNKLQNIMGKADPDGWVRDPGAVADTKSLLNGDPKLLAMLPSSALDALQKLSTHFDDVKDHVSTDPTASPGAPDPGGMMAPGPSGVGTSSVPSFVEASDAKVSKDDLDGAIKALTNESSALSSTNELKMIQLQSAISARGNLLSMVSNMVKSFDDNAKSIVGNMR